MGLKAKHSKKLKKARAKRETEKKSREPDIDFDTSAYVIYNRLGMTYPCLSFDIVPEESDRDVTKFPLSLKLVAGAQTPPHVEQNYIYVMKCDNINQLKQENEDVDDEEEEEEDNSYDEQSNLPGLTSVRVQHKGCVNRIRLNKIGGKVYSASWSDKGKVYIFDLTTPLQAVEDQRSIKTYTAQKIEPKPFFTFGGHLNEGYAVDWSRTRTGSLATGDCTKNIHVWTMRPSDWNVDQQPLVGHEKSVEDIKWSPENCEMLASCSVDKSIRLWDLRESGASKNVITVQEGHMADINVIDWNRKNSHLIASGGDDGVVRVWDTRYIGREKKPFPVADFHYHQRPITSIEWNPHDDTVMAVSSEDDRLTLWDLAVERDDEQEQADAMDLDNQVKHGNESSSSSEDEDDEEEEDDKDEEFEDLDEETEEKDKIDKDIDGVEYGDLDFKKIPEQMLFLHQGQQEIKELHWHPQFDGLLISTALNGLNVFKTISA